MTERAQASFREPEQITIGPPKLTRFEKARVVGARALQVSMGAPVLLELPEGTMSPIDIALVELREGVLPISIRRSLPDGTSQNIPLKWLLVPETLEEQRTARERKQEED
ncbi:DNA-directed RNA polymerase subunit K [Candidatus Bathyarchaeota archaeon]|nr:MAG: DNA-directed RNA polymerase subunit K [Candidatus Bathyarchaeota archaeon]